MNIKFVDINEELGKVRRFDAFVIDIKLMSQRRKRIWYWKTDVQVFDKITDMGVVS